MKIHTPPSLKPKHGLCSGLALALLLIASPAYSQSSTYISTPDLADYSGVSASGGTISVPFQLIFGTPPPSLGSSFDITIQVSSITSYVSGVSYSWSNTPPDPALSVVGLTYPGNLFDVLPATNQNALAVNSGSVILDPGVNDRLWMESHIANANLAFLGEFTITIAALPSTPGFVAPTQVNVWSEFSSFLVDGENVLAGFWATMGPPLEESNTNISTRITDFGQSITYQFTAFSSGPILPISDTSLVWNHGGFAQFEPIPEPSSAVLIILAGTLTALRRRRGPPVA